MNLLRGLLFDNIGLKLVALLMAVLVYLNVYTDRPATLMMSFPLQLADLSDSLSLSGPVPSVVQAELRATGKQLIRLRMTEPRLRVSLAGVGTGRFERSLSQEDLPIGALEGVSVERLVGPRVIELTIDRKVQRRIPVRVQIEGVAAAGIQQVGAALADPGSLLIIGPYRAVSVLDSVNLNVVRIDGRRDTLRAQAAPEGLPDWCTSDPPVVTVMVPLARAPKSP